MSYVTHDGIWAPDDHHPAIPINNVDDGMRLHAWFPDPYINVELQAAQADVQEPQSIWEMVKFTGAVWGRMLETRYLEVAEWDHVGRGDELPQLQSPNVVSGNVYERQRLDRFGPFNDPRLSQNAIEAYLDAAVPSEVSNLEAANGWGGNVYFPGYGRPGG